MAITFNDQAAAATPWAYDPGVIAAQIGATVKHPVTGADIPVPRINAAQEATINTRIQNMPKYYSTQRQAFGTQLKGDLAGYGGLKYTMNNDGTLKIDYDENAPLGDKQRAAVKGTEAQFNASGILSSSFADKGIGTALGQQSAEMQRVINQYFQNIIGINRQEATDWNDLSSQVSGLLGQDVMYAVDHAPVTGTPPPTPAAPVTIPNATVGDPMTVGATRSAGLGRYVM